MPNSTTTQPLFLRIAGLIFQIPRRYTAGHIINSAEASALNALMLENIGNNLRREISAVAQANPGAVALRELRGRVVNYAAKYSFSTRTAVVTGRPPAVVEKAQTLVRQYWLAIGRQATEDEITAEALEPTWQQTAMQMLLEERTIAEALLAELAEPPNAS